VIPRAFVPTRVRYVSDPSATVSEMAEETDFRRVAWIEEPGRSAGEDVNGPARVSSEDDGPDLVLTVETSAPAWIVVSQTNWKGWRAVCRGKRLPVRFADHALLAVQAPAGRSRIRLEYQPVSFRRGEAIAAAALVILIGAAVARQRRR